jgi:hypothetical protein
MFGKKLISISKSELVVWCFCHQLSQGSTAGIIEDREKQFVHPAQIDVMMFLQPGLPDSDMATGNHNGLPVLFFLVPPDGDDHKPSIQKHSTRVFNL